MDLHRRAGALVGSELRLLVAGGLQAALERACGWEGQTLRHDAKE
jgi:hypothetical protein